MARFNRLAVLNTVLADGLVPLFYQADLSVAQKITAALAIGGSRLLEFTNRGDFAIEVFSGLIQYCAQAYPQMIIGVGSVEDAPTAALYLAHGANFVVGPTFQEEVARLCNRRKVAYLPGCATLTEITRAEEWGVEIVKVFPGGAAGGPEFIRDVLGPRPWSRLMPTGGVSPDEDNLRAWFQAGVACVGLGSKLIRIEWVKAGDFDAITTLTQTTLQQIRQLRT
ncbi:MAG TPA: bifunctional 4-hydroxy-2-oxoglutarate aldolase/2-dehydro-3-deoxy-phosphogluconate aldolase [Phototrophicaceae bacterium]|nr:bifunctional 4-hydroxy-2-oxoglutarate aldolase/2-dehydro-3-deoxy-phosphogluconate aldolase [Phototrophicaceae bacterium]